MYRRGKSQESRTEERKIKGNFWQHHEYHGKVLKLRGKKREKIYDDALPFRVVPNLTIIPRRKKGIAKILSSLMMLEKVLFLRVARPQQKVDHLKVN